MTRKDFFLLTLATLMARRSPDEAVVEVMSAAWRFPEASVPDDPALAAGEFVRWMFASSTTPPAWVAEGLELQTMLEAEEKRRRERAIEKFREEDPT